MDTDRVLDHAEQIRAAMERARACVIGILGDMPVELERVVTDDRIRDVLVSGLVRAVANALVHIEDAAAHAEHIGRELCP